MRNIKIMIFSSSAAVYGIPKFLPVDETHPLNPINFYGFTKLEIERILSWYSKLKDIRFGALRYFNAAGYDIKGRIKGLEKNPANLLPIIMETLIGKRNYINIYGNDYDTRDGTGIRDYIHVSDLAIAHVKTLETIINHRKNIILNLATGKGYSVLEIIEKASQISGQEIDYNLVDRREGDIAELLAVSKLAGRTINWDCQYSDIQNILKSMLEVYK